MRDIERALALLAGMETSDRDFFDLAAEALALALDCRWAGIVERTADRRTMHFLAYRVDGERANAESYAIKGTPSERFYQASAKETHHLVADGPLDKYPRLKEWAGPEVASCRTELFHASDGEPRGHVFVMDDKPMVDDPEAQTFFRLVGQRLGAEFNRLASERALAASEAKFRRLVDGSTQGIAVMRNSRILFANDACARIFGHDRAEDLIGGNLRDYTAAEEEPLLGSIRAARLTGELKPFRQEVSGTRKDGRPVIADCAISLVDWEGAPAVQVVMNDITGQKNG